MSLTDPNLREPQNCYYFLPDGTKRSMIDPAGFKIMDEYKTAVHDGYAFGLDQDNHGAALATGSAYLIGKVGSKQVHFEEITGKFQKGGVRIELFEAPTYTGGTPLTPYAMSRVSAITPTMTILSGVTVTNDGVKAGGVYFPLTGAGVNTQNAVSSLAGGRVLKANTDYAIKVTNLDAAAVFYGINFIWYEADYTLGTL